MPIITANVDGFPYDYTRMSIEAMVGEALVGAQINSIDYIDHLSWSGYDFVTTAIVVDDHSDYATDDAVYFNSLYTPGFVSHHQIGALLSNASSIAIGTFVDSFLLTGLVLSSNVGPNTITNFRAYLEDTVSSGVAGVLLEADGPLAAGDEYLADTLTDFNGTNFSGFSLDRATFFAAAAAYRAGDTAPLMAILNSYNYQFAGSSSADQIAGYALADTLSGGGGADLLLGRNGNDNLFGGTNNDTLYGDGGHDTLDGGSGYNTLYGGPGNDTYVLTGGANTIDDESGVDTITFLNPTILDFNTVTLGGDAVGLNLVGSYIEVYRGSSGNDTIALLASDSTSGSLYGNGGADRLSGNATNNFLYGGDGEDTLNGLAQDDTLYGDEATDKIFGDDGNDTLYGGGTWDELFGGNGTDSLYGGADEDYLFGGSGNDRLHGEDGRDWLVGGSGNDVLLGANGSDTAAFDHVGSAQGGWTIDLSLGRATTTFYVFSGGGVTTAQELDSILAIENVRASDGHDVITGSGDANILDGSYGDDTIYGGGGADSIEGGYGQDTLWGSYGADGAADSIDGGGGNDTYFLYETGDQAIETLTGIPHGGTDLVYTASNRTLTANIENLTLFGNSATLSSVAGNQLDNALNGMQYTGGSGVTFGADLGNDTIYGTSYGDTIIGDGGNDTLWGSWGADGRADALFGGDGADTYYVQETLDTVTETNAGTGMAERDIVYAGINYTLGANQEVLFVYGSATQATGNGLDNAIIGSYLGSPLTLNGLGGADSITGGAGNDTINGGTGIDALTGSGGADMFVFVAGHANGDAITDFDGAGAGALDSLRFVGYGAGAAFTQLNATQWRLTYNGGASTETITFTNSASIHAQDYAFV